MNSFLLKLGDVFCLHGFHSFSIFAFFIFTSCNLCAQGTYRDPSVLRDPTGYKLRIGDKVRVVIRGENDCTTEGTINSEGKLRLVYIGEIPLTGLSKKQAEDRISKKYIDDFIFRKPVVSLSMTSYVIRSVFLSGAVNNKGPYSFPPEVEAMNIVEVIARAGGFNDIAKKNKVYVTRTFFNESGSAKETKTYEVDVEALSTGSIRGSNQRFWIYPGDRIEVPERLI